MRLRSIEGADGWGCRDETSDFAKDTAAVAAPGEPGKGRRFYQNRPAKVLRFAVFRPNRRGHGVRSLGVMKLILSTLCAITLVTASAFAKDVDIPVTELPKAVTDAVMKAHPGAALLSAEKDLKADGSIEKYEVKIRIADKEKELDVLADGTIQKTENDD